VIPVVWKERLFLFWLRILKEPASTTPNVPDGTTLSDVNQALAQDPPMVIVKAMLCRSEYYDGQWQPTRTSDVNRPAELGSLKPWEIEFLRPNLEISVFEEQEALRISIGGYRGSSFLLYNTFSLPVPGEPEITPHEPAGSGRSIWTAVNKTFQIK